MNWGTTYRCTLVSLLWITALAAQPTQIVSGRVLGYHANRIGDYDGVQLDTAAGVTWLPFPPHLAAQVLRIAAVGQVVIATVAGQPQPEAPRRRKQADRMPVTYRLLRLQNATTKEGVRVAGSPLPPPRPGKLVTVDEPLTGDLRDARGRLLALLTDHYLIEIKPHQSESLRSLLVGIRRLGVVGYERTEPGFVNKTGRKLIHPTALTINQQTFTL